jgi:hypothetical protein
MTNGKHTPQPSAQVVNKKKPNSRHTVDSLLTISDDVLLFLRLQVDCPVVESHRRGRIRERSSNKVQTSTRVEEENQIKSNKERVAEVSFL